MSAGEYLVAVYGENLEETANRVAYKSGTISVDNSTLIRQDNIIILRVTLPKYGEDTEIITYNTGTDDIIVKSIKIIRLTGESNVEAVKSQLLAE